MRSPSSCFLLLGSIDTSESYHVALISNQRNSDTVQEDSKQIDTEQSVGQHEPPVSEGEQRVVKIEDLGDRGDGITRVERGFVVIIPETEVGERVRIRIETVREIVAFGEVVKRD